MKNALILLALALSAPAFAQTQAGSQSGSVASTENVNAPVFNTSNPADTRATIDTNQAASAATVFVNPPAADTCIKAGSGASVQAVGVGAAVTLGGDESVKCDMRADTINLKVTGAPITVVKARQCMDKQMEEAYARAGEPCIDKRPDRRATAILNDQPDPVVVRRQPMPWQAGG